MGRERMSERPEEPPGREARAGHSLQSKGSGEPGGVMGQLER